jgi:hypothetical protein
MLAGIVSFQPMFSFVSAGINNDTGSNLLGIVLFWISLKILNHGLNLRSSLIICICLLLGMYTKPLILPIIAATGVALLYEFIRSKRKILTEITYLSPLIIGSLFVIFVFFVIPKLNSGSLPYVPSYNPDSPTRAMPLTEYLPAQIIRYYRETYVWYWGIFKWLGVTLPLIWIKITKLWVIAAGLGIMLFFLPKRPRIVNLKTVALAAIFSLTYLLTLTWWDYNMIKSMGFSHGLQGRYFFPTIVPHLVLLMIGTMNLFKSKYRYLIAGGMLVFMITLQLVSMLRLASAYYPATGIYQILMQMSQYKTGIIKYPFNLLWTGLYCLSIFVLIYQLFLGKKREHKISN